MSTCPEPRRRVAADPDESTRWSSRTGGWPTSSTRCSRSRASTRCSSAIADTVSELIPYDDITSTRRTRRSATLRAVLARGNGAEEVLADEPFPFGEGITGWAVEHREPVLANRAAAGSARPVRRRHANRPRVADLGAARSPRGRLKGTLNIYRTGYQAVHRGGVPARRPLRRRRGARDRQRAHPRHVSSTRRRPTR